MNDGNEYEGWAMEYSKETKYMTQKRRDRHDIYNVKVYGSGVCWMVLQISKR